MSLQQAFFEKLSETINAYKSASSHDSRDAVKKVLESYNVVLNEDSQSGELVVKKENDRIFIFFGKNTIENIDENVSRFHILKGLAYGLLHLNNGDSQIVNYEYDEQDIDNVEAEIFVYNVLLPLIPENGRRPIEKELESEKSVEKLSKKYHFPQDKMENIMGELALI